MKAPILWCLLALTGLYPSAASAEWNFSGCAQVLETPEFQPLRAALERSKLLESADTCLALAPPREYVVITWSQVYYCDVSTPTGCVENVPGH